MVDRPQIEHWWPALLQLFVFVALALMVLSPASAVGEEHFTEGELAYALKDYPKAFRLTLPKAQEGDAGSQWLLGMMYANGEGVPQNYNEAIKWYRLSAEQGHFAAMYDLGGMFESGQGVVQDYVRAHMWFNLAASRSSRENFRKSSIAARNSVARRMTQAQIARAQEKAQICEKTDFKICD